MKTIEVVAAIICKEGKFFATQRGYGEFEGWWEFPGGKIESGEEKEDARWLSTDELDEVGWLPADRDVIEMLKEIN